MGRHWRTRGLNAQGWGSIPLRLHIVDILPQPISAALTNVWFWTCIGLMPAFFLATLVVERTITDRSVQSGLGLIFRKE
ncbi:hypothetical protein AAII07_46255 [Microvirga sp. 0TCS3.31]|jgi:hypothetical protein